MASVAASSFASRSTSPFHHGLASGSDTKGLQMKIGLMKQTMTHNGLRCLNKEDQLYIKTKAKVNSMQAERKRFRTEKVRTKGLIVCGSGMNLVFLGTEVAPWSKTGGLGDVHGGLPPAMAAFGHRVMTIAPRYDQYKDAWDTEVVIEVKVGDKIEMVRFFHCYKRGVDRVFVDHPWFLEKVWGKTKSKIYGPITGVDYQDNQLRFSLLCQVDNLCPVGNAALEAPRVLNLNSSKYFSGPYGEDVVFIANDWHTALLPCYLKSMYKDRGIYKSAKVRSLACSFDFIDGYDKPVKGRKINWMKAGILQADKVLTVSPHYAQELVSGVDKGVELDNILRKTGVTGIVNGMDVQEWNPSTDKYIGVKYDASTVMDAKPLLKEALQAEVGLPVDRNIPVIGFIGRLEEQKGSDILVAAIPQFIRENVQIIVLGTGKKTMEKQLEQLEILYPDKARGVAKFNVCRYKICDTVLQVTFLCGLIQLHAMRYGTVPIVASTGGLVDTVQEGFTGFQMGSFSVECDAVDPTDVSAVATSVGRALATYGTQALTEMIKNCMAQDLSWKGPAKKWEEVLLSLGVDGSEPGIQGEEIAPLAKENVATP
ncbi:hypothetical protein Pint_00667 [Pistacia integerrima]|uniref:Uncharacterized protein n=1 Tax=Pistacia integerrima TaxID=434235 RepID=A0ACC0ZLB3_9ROSI|nr:hypothetical protein Pint_00667 [Pistacia integerrima]